MQEREDGLIDRTVVFWQPRMARALRKEDARQMIENVVGFFGTLMEWDRREQSDAGAEPVESSRDRFPMRRK